MTVQTYRHNFFASALSLAFASAFSNCVLAAESALDEVVVTATRQSNRSNELMSDVTVISREEIERSGQTSLEQLLARQPSMDYYANGGPGSSSGVFIRGTSPKQSIVLVNGQRFSSASSGDAALSRIALSQIERIEILRGPASSLYGADAMGGVIQIFTRQGDGTTRFDATVGFGSDRSSSTSVGVSAGTDKISYSLQAGYSDVDGLSAIRNPANSSYNSDKDGYRNRNFVGNVVFRPAPGQEIGLNLLQSNGINKYDSYPSLSNYENSQDVSTYALHSRNRLNSIWTSTVRLGRSIDDGTNFINGKPSDVYRTEQDQLSWQNDLILPVGQALLAAEYLKQNLSSSTAFSTSERTIRSLLAGWHGNIGKHRLQFNMRHDSNSQFGEKTTGLGAYGYQLTPDWRAHISYGTAYRAPNFNEMYFPDSGFGGGNSKLTPELATNREAGLNWERGTHHFSAVYFNNHIKDLISGWPAININQATLSGSTFSYDAHLNEWGVGVSGDFLHAIDDLTGQRLVRRAKQQLKSHLTRSVGNWNFGGEWQLVGSRYDDAANTRRMGGYGVINLTTDYRLERNWVLFARINNLFNKDYELARDYATPRSSLFIGIRYSSK